MKKILLLLFLLNFGQIYSQDTKNWNVALGMMLYEEGKGNATDYLDLMLNLNVSHKISKKNDIGISYYQLVRSPYAFSYNHFIISLFSTFHLYQTKFKQKQIKWFAAPHVGYGTIFAAPNYVIYEVPNQYYLGAETGFSYPISQKYTLSLSAKGFYPIYGNEFKLWHIRPFLVVSRTL